MNILMINNYNYLRGGAETVAITEMSLLRIKGERVTIFSRKHPQNFPSEFEQYFPPEMVTDTITPSAKGLRSFLGLFYSLKAKNCLNSLLQEVTVDVAHVHNIYGRLTTSILDVLHDKGIPVVMTLHDYKLICPNYKLMHHGKICEDCRGDRYYNAVLNRCHKNSLIASAIYALETSFNFLFKKYRKNVNYFISPSQFLKGKLVEFGWPGERIVYIPNFLSIAQIEPQYAPGDYFLYLGRLSSEKGIETLIKAFSDLPYAHIQLKIAGEGPLESFLKARAAGDQRIYFCGYLSGEPLADITRQAMAVVVPSEWYENAPLSVLEAMAYGKPVIGARIGGIPEMIDDGRNGFLFASGDSAGLNRAMATLIEMDSAAIEAMGRSAHRKIETEYNAELHYERLMDVYGRAMRECEPSPRRFKPCDGLPGSG